MVIADPAKEVIGPVGTSLCLPFGGFAVHIQEGITIRSKEVPNDGMLN